MGCRDRLRPLLRVVGCLVATLTAIGCDEARQGPATDDRVNCAEDSRVDTYSNGMSKSSVVNSRRVTLIHSDPAPPARGNNSWRIRVTDAAGVAVTPPHLVVRLFMPDHGHGANVTPVIAAMGEGIYDITSLNLFMAGIWRISIASTPRADDDVQYFFCVMG